MKRSGLLLPFILLAACSDSPDILPASQVDRSGYLECLLGARSDPVTAASWNMSIGFEVKDLLFLNLDSLRVIRSRAEKIFADAARSLPRQRVRLMAQEIAAARPDVVGLQETMHLERNGVLVADFLDSLESDLASLGVPYRMLRRPLNGATLRIAPLPDSNGVSNPADSIVMTFSEGQALLVSSRWTVVEEGLIPFRNVIPVDLLGTKTVTDRSAQWAWLRDGSGFQLEVWNTHLEVLNAQIVAQAGEFKGFADSLRAAKIRQGFAPSGRLFLGDINSEPGRAADTILSNAGWRDVWSTARWGTGNTWGGGGPRDTTRKLTQRIDRVLVQGACAIDSAWLQGDRPQPTDSGWLFPSDHAMVAARIRYGIRP